jgi:hypothetical protein
MSDVRKRHDDGAEVGPNPGAGAVAGAGTGAADGGGRIVSGAAQAGSATPADEDAALRPRTFAEFVGQRKVAENLAVYVKAARQRGDSLDHVLLSGPPGLGIL